MKAEDIGDVSLEKMLAIETLKFRAECRKIDQDFQGDAFNLIKSQALALAFNQIERANFTKSDETNHGFIPFPCQTFMDMIIEAYVHLGQIRGKKFLEVGCGIGTKVLLAQVFFDGHGIEFDRTIEKASVLGVKNLTQADCLAYDKYGEYDFLYFFRPIRAAEKQIEFEHRIHDQMKSGAVIAPIYTELDWNQFEDLTKLGWIYQKN